jgi:hypothetical protein
LRIDRVTVFLTLWGASFTASGTPTRAGSAIATRPIRVRSDSADGRCAGTLPPAAQDATDPARATHLFRALLALTNIEVTTGN